MANKSKSKRKRNLKRMASLSLAALMTAGCIDATLVSASAATTDTPSSSILSDSDRGVIFANSRTDFRDESIYFMMVTRFYNGDESNDVQCWDGTQYNLNDPAWRGDFKGVIEKLDYIKALGFTAIWITPVVENCSGYDYHGYHAFDMSKVDPRYESDDCTYQDLIDACHAKGMKIIQDVVFNHTGNFGEKNLIPMFTKEGDLSSPDCLQVLPESGLPSNYNELAPGFQYQARLALMKNTDGENHDVNNLYHHYGNFNWDDYTCQIAQIAGDCVDLNTENPLVYNYLVDTYSKYIDMGVDGFRVDTVRHISRLTFNKVFNDAFIEAGKRNGKDFYMFGEVCTRDNGNVWYRQSPSMSTPFYTWKDSKDYEWSDTDWEVNYNSAIQNTLDNADNVSEQPTSQNALLDGNNYHTPDYSQFSGLNVIDFPMHWSFKTAESAFQVAKRGDMYYNDATWNVTYVDSHDYAPDGAPENKRFDQDQSTWAENLALMFTFRGIPCIYYGTETEFKKGKPIDVGPNAPLEETGRAYYGDNIEGTVIASDFGVYGNLSGTVADTLMHPLSQHIQRLNRVRQAIPALRKGQYSTEGCSGNLSFKRRYTDDKTDSFVCVTISGDSTFTGIPNGKYVDAITGDVKNVTDGTLNATVSGKGNMKVYVLDTAKTPAPGRVIPNGVYLTDGGANQPITGVDIEIVQPTSITLDKTSVTVKEATTEKVKATVAPDNATNKTVSWTTSNASVATVAGGNITGVSKGTATITAKTSNGLTATVKVTVVDNPDIIRPTGITLDKKSLSLIEGASEKLTATVAPANATNKKVTWTSSDTSIATVDGLGNVKAVLEGTATITAETINGYKATATVTVTAKQITAIRGIYFEKPADWASTINVYFFANDKDFGKSWPGTPMTDLGDGVYGYQIESTNPDLMIVFNDGNNHKTLDLEYVQNGYYNSSGYVKTIEPATKGTVNVKYVDESGNVLGTDKLTGDFGTSYTTSAKTFDGYTLKTTPSNATGSFTETAITVTYVYKANETPVTPLTNNSTISKTTINKGDSVTLKAVAAGGTAPYKYAFSAKHSTASTWTSLKGYNTTATHTW
ncbi:MAG: alpha-amylase family glycosyl hydrolase, partial [Acutalibacteraceae bacterium]